MEYQTLLVTTPADSTALITLNRPEKRNCLSIQVRRELMDCLDRLEADPGVTVAVLTGAGEVFCAGFDLKEFTKPDIQDELVQTSRDYHLKMWNFPKPILAAVNGPAPAGGLDLSLLCDIRLCSTTAFFGHPEIRFGAIPLFSLLAQVVGEGSARDLCFTGRMIPAEEALRMGLVSEVVEPGELMPLALEWAAMIAETPAATLAFTKRAMARTAGSDFETAFRREHDEGFAAVPLLHDKLPRK